MHRAPTRTGCAWVMLSEVKRWLEVAEANQIKVD